MTVLCVVCAFTLTSSSSNAQNSEEPLIAHVRAYRLDHIPVEDAERLLVDLKIARDAQQIADTDTLLVTADRPKDLVKTSNLLNIIDHDHLYIMNTSIFNAACPKSPVSEQISNQLDNDLNDIAIGSFANPPKSTEEKPAAIVDVHNSNLIVVAYKRPVVEEIAEAIDELRASSQLNLQPKALAEETENKPNMPQQKTLSASNKESLKSTDQVGITAMPHAEKELELIITLPEKIEITALLELVGKQLGLDYIYDPKKVRGSVTLKVDEGKIKVKEVYSLLESVLKLKGLVMTRRGNLVTIVPKAEALKYDPTFYDSTEQIQAGDVIVSSVFTLQHITPKTAENFLKSMTLGLSFNSIPKTGTFIVTGYTYRMSRIEELLEMIDVPGEPRKLVFRQLQYTLASAVVSKVKTLADKLRIVPITISAKQPTPSKPQTAAQRRAAARRRRSRRRRPPVKTKKPVVEEKKGLYLDADDRTNRITMIGSQEDIDTVNSVINTLDIRLQSSRTIKEYKLENISAEEAKDYLDYFGVSEK